MGSKGQKPRKGKSRQHLAKVGAHTNHQKGERRAVEENLGLGHAPPWLRITAMVVVVMLIVGAIGSLLILTLR
jgi:hypothetical protein